MGTNDHISPSPLHPLHLFISADVVSAHMYTLNVSIGSANSIRALSMSLLFINVQSFESSGQFVVDHYRIDFDVNGGFIEIDS